ncbi:MAG: FkbM family methyltransferase, partial [Xanthomonadales bacterium]|nr:FkbM family methyltransferase [Xanthomonadales bacterium]
DVGANLGQTLLAVKAIDRQREYLGFEPNPSCNFYLEQLIRLNGLEQVSVVPVALADESCVMQLDRYSDDPGDSSASIVPAFRDESKIKSSLFVPAFRFDDLRISNTRSSIGIVKIDVEGAESVVLSSLNTVIKRDRPLIVMEVLPVYSDENQERLVRQQSIERMLTSWNYKLYRIAKHDDGSLAGLVPIKSFGIHSNIDHCDYLAIGSERSGEIDERFELLIDRGD